MALFFNIVRGDQEGRRFEIREGLSIGRIKGDIVLDDAKVSSLHAQVKKEDKDKFVLVDNNSSNGLLINGKRVEKASLLPGTIIQIGHAFLKVVEDNSDENSELLEEDWLDILKDHFLMGKTAVKAFDRGVAPFESPLRLTFIQGIQTDQVWEIAYGPRSFGHSFPEFPLHEPNCPDHCFTLTPNPEGALFKTEIPKEIFLNGEQKSAEKLKEGDLIHIGDTIIKVEFTKV